MALIQVFDKRTGEPVERMIPEHWLDIPKLGGNFTRTQPTGASKGAVKSDKKEN